MGVKPLNLDREHWEMIANNDEPTPSLNHFEMMYQMMQLAGEHAEDCTNAQLSIKQLLEDF